MESCEEVTVEVDGIAVRVRKGGSGPPLLFLHGAGGGGRWDVHHQLLSQHFTVYAPDHPGWSDTEHAEWMDTMLDYVLYCDGLLRALNVVNPTLVGHSLGGWMAASLASVYPDRFARLVLVNAAGMPITDEPVPDFFASAARGGQAFAQMLFRKPEVAAAYFPAELTLEERLLRYRHLTSTARIAWHCWFDDKMEQRLKRVKMPTAVVWGEYDGIFPASLGRKYAAAIEGARLTILPDCAHMVPLEDPGALLSAILDLPIAGVNLS